MCDGHAVEAGQLAVLRLVAESMADFCLPRKHNVTPHVCAELLK